MKEQVYKLGFPRAKKLIVFLSLIAVLGFMATVFQGYSRNEEGSISEQAYQESADEIESLFVMAVR